MIEFKTDLRLAESGRTLNDSLHLRGLFCFDIIRDSKDVDWIHDLNARAFSGLTTCQLAGFDFRGAYLRCRGPVDVRSGPPEAPSGILLAFQKVEEICSDQYRIESLESGHFGGSGVTGDCSARDTFSRSPSIDLFLRGVTT